MTYHNPPSRLFPFFKSLALTTLAALPCAPLNAEDLPIVSGVALLHAADAKNCVSGSAALDNVLKELQRGQENLRSISMAWSDITPLLEDEKADIFSQLATKTLAPDLDPDTQKPTVHRFPDDRIFTEIAACSNPTLNESAEIEEAPGRIWALTVTGAPTAPRVALPGAWSTYVDVTTNSDKTLTTCLLMGGALPRQPAAAAQIAAAIEGEINESLASSAPKAHAHSARLASGLFHPGALRMRGWDLVLLAGLSEDITPATACDALIAQYLQEDDAAPSLGPNPQEALSDCPASGLQPGESLRQRILFEESDESLQTAPTDLFANLETCADLSGPNISLTIEAYGSTDGSSQKNWTISKSRADFVLEALRPIGIPTVSGGFGESEMFSDDLQGNRVAFVTLNAGPILSPRNGSIDSALLRRYLERNGTCTMQPNLTSDLLPFLTSPFGTRLLDALSTPDFVVMFHNARDTRDTIEFARNLKRAAQNERSCRGTGGTTHVGFLYKRTGAPFWNSNDTELLGSEPVTDYFILPPEITWIYPIDENAQYDLLAEVAKDFGILSQNLLGPLSEIGELNKDELKALVGQVDVLTVTVPTPISTVLQRLENAQAGTGWVNLTAGWD